jgi:anti-sigma28 factor (negative regulator of flagellin synthesis)
MKINNSIFDPLRPDRGVPAEQASPARTGETAKPAAPAPAVRRDSVQISDSARSMASRMAADSRANLDPERVAELRNKVYTGAYNSLDVVDQVARRILTRGDL